MSVPTPRDSGPQFNENDNKITDERAHRVGKIFSTVGPLFFFFGIILAGVGTYLYITPELMGPEDMTGMILLIVAIIFLFDGIFFTVLGRRSLARAKATQEQQQQH